jgi:hypothetical protein
MECGGELVGGWLSDAQLRRLIDAEDYTEEVGNLKLRYPPPVSAGVTANGDQGSQPSSIVELVSLIGGLLGG